MTDPATRNQPADDADVIVRAEWHHGSIEIVGAYVTDEGLLDLDRLAADLTLPPLVRGLDVWVHDDDPWCLTLVDIDTDDTLGVAYVAAGAGA